MDSKPTTRGIGPGIGLIKAGMRAEEARGFHVFRFLIRFVNPYPGTIADHVVTRPEYNDFFLISQSGENGTTSWWEEKRIRSKM